MITIGHAATLTRVVADCAVSSASDRTSLGVAVVSSDLRPYDSLETVRAIGTALGFTTVLLDAAAGAPRALASGVSRADAFSVTERRHIEDAGPRLFAVTLDDVRDASALAMLAAAIADMRIGSAPTIILGITSGPYDDMAETHALVSRALRLDPDDVTMLKF
jgi:hypothetical protein